VLLRPAPARTPARGPPWRGPCPGTDVAWPEALRLGPAWRIRVGPAASAHWARVGPGIPLAAPAQPLVWSVSQGWAGRPDSIVRRRPGWPHPRPGWSHGRALSRVQAAPIAHPRPAPERHSIIPKSPQPCLAPGLPGLACVELSSSPPPPTIPIRLAPGLPGLAGAHGGANSLEPVPRAPRPAPSAPSTPHNKR
jgi:hypothetical protein